MLLVVDANVLIDYAKADESVLALVVRHVGPVYVPRDVLDEVDQVDEDPAHDSASRSSKAPWSSSSKLARAAVAFRSQITCA